MSQVFVVRRGSLASHCPVRCWDCSPRISAVGVERDDVPAAHVVAVVALASSACGCAEVVEVPLRGGIRGITTGAAGREVLVVPDRRMRNRLHATPARIVGLLEGLEAAAFVLVVPERKDGGESSPDGQIRRVSLTAVGGRPRATVEVRVRGVAGDVAAAAITGSPAAETIGGEAAPVASTSPIARTQPGTTPSRALFRRDISRAIRRVPKTPFPSPQFFRWSRRDHPEPYDV